MTIIGKFGQGRGGPRQDATGAEHEAAHRERKRVILRDKQRVRREEDRQAKIVAGTDRPVGRPRDLNERERAEASRRRRRVVTYSYRDQYLEDARTWREENPVRVAKMAEEWAEQVKLTAEAILREFAATPEEDRQALALELLDSENRVFTAATRYSSVNQLLGTYAGF
jgi:hypothetical protein